MSFQRRFSVIVLSGLCLSIQATHALASGTYVPSAKVSDSSIKKVALSFDDGPYGTSTLQILDILKKEKVPATFFLIGKNVDEYPAITKLIVTDGFNIGNHTYTHPNDLPYLSSTEIKAELSKTDTAIASSTGVHTKLFRPPYGNINKRLRRILKKEGYKVILWNVDPKDWNYASSTSSMIEQTVEAQEKTHMTIVMHDGRDTQINYPRGNLIEALPSVIEDLKKEGYLFVTADTLAF